MKGGTVRVSEYLGIFSLFIFQLVAIAGIVFLLNVEDEETVATTLAPCAIESQALTMCAEMLAECYQPQSLAPGERSI